MRVPLRRDELLVVRRPLQRAHLLRARTATLTAGVRSLAPPMTPTHPPGPLQRVTGYGCNAHACPRDRVTGYGCRRARSAWLQARAGCRRARRRLQATVAGYGCMPASVCRRRSGRRPSSSSRSGWCGRRCRRPRRAGCAATGTWLGLGLGLALTLTLTLTSRGEEVALPRAPGDGLDSGHVALQPEERLACSGRG